MSQTVVPTTATSAMKPTISSDALLRTNAAWLIGMYVPAFSSEHSPGNL